MNTLISIIEMHSLLCCAVVGLLIGLWHPKSLLTTLGRTAITTSNALFVGWVSIWTADAFTAGSSIHVTEIGAVHFMSVFLAVALSVPIRIFFDPSTERDISAQ